MDCFQIQFWFPQNNEHCVNVISVNSVPVCLLAWLFERHFPRQTCFSISESFHFRIWLSSLLLFYCSKHRKTICTHLIFPWFCIRSRIWYTIHRYINKQCTHWENYISRRIKYHIWIPHSALLQHIPCHWALSLHPTENMVCSPIQFIIWTTKDIPLSLNNCNNSVPQKQRWSRCNVWAPPSIDENSISLFWLYAKMNCTNDMKRQDKYSESGHCIIKRSLVNTVIANASANTYSSEYCNYCIIAIIFTSMNKKIICVYVRMS